WDEKQTQLVFFSSRAEAKATPPKYRVYHWQRQSAAAARDAALRLAVDLVRPAPGQRAQDRLLNVGLNAHQLRETQAVELLGTNPTGLKDGFALSERGGLSFTAAGDRLLFSVAPVKAEAKPAAAGDRAVFDLWHWKDDFIQPMQKVKALQDQN